MMYSSLYFLGAGSSRVTGGGLGQFLFHEVLQVLGVAEHQVATGDAPAPELLLGDLSITFRRVQHMEHILLVLDPARQEGKLVEKAVQVDLIVDVVQIGLALDNVNLVFHSHASLSQKSNSMHICPPQSIIRRRSFPWGVMRVC